MFQSISADNVGGGGEGAAPAPFRNGSHFGGLSGGARVCPRVPAKVNRRKSYVQAGGSIPRVSQQQDKERTLPPKATDFDVAYFHSYAHLGIHEEMIKDRVRTETYRNAIFQHQDRIAGKVVVDVGCGTGILSIFCAQAGARRVYAVDASDIAVQANEVVKANNLSETVFVLHGRVEDVEINEKVDVIVSEWMGYMLLYESMLGSVITARDRWLKPGGLILPSHATLYIAPVCHSDRYNDSVGFWRNVYGIDMSAMMPLAKQCAFEEPSVESISGENVLAWPNVVKHVDCSTVTIQELESITATFRFTSMMRVPFHGFAFWFDVEFGVPAKHSSSDKASPASIEASDDKIDLGVPAIRSSSDKASPSSVEAPRDKIDLGVPAIHSSSEKASPSSVEAPRDKIDLGVPAIHSSSDKASPSSIEAPHDKVTGSSSSMKRAHPDDIVAGSSPSTKRAKPNKPLILSTAPENSPTHWQQTLIYLFEPLDMEQDQIIEGSVTLAQSKENARFMNIRLEYKACGHSFVKESVMR